MAEMFETPPKRSGINAGLIVGVVVGLLLIGGLIWWVSRAPTVVDQSVKILEGSYREGAPEFAALAKGIQIARDDDRTVESPTGLGSISMFIRGNVYNRTGKRITALEITVSVINQQNQPIKQKAVLVVPVQQPVLEVGETIPITCSLDGFDRKDDRANINFKVTAIKVEG